MFTGKSFKHIKHIFFITIIAVSFLFGYIMIFSGEFSHSLNGFFIYRTGNGVWQDYFHQHTLKPSNHIAIIKIDDRTINSLQATGDLKMLTIPKKHYRDLVERLSNIGVRGVAFDIVFQNADDDEASFVKMMEEKKNTVVGTAVGETENCTTDTRDGSITCDGYPRIGYTSVPWGMINIGTATKSGGTTNILAGVFSRPTQVDIRNTTVGNWKYNLGLDTRIYSLPIALLALTDESITRRPEFRMTSMQNPYFGPPGVYPNYSLIDVLKMSDADLAKYFQGKYVFFGESGTLIHDSLNSPVSGTDMDGVESHAHFLDGLLQDKMLHSFDYNFVVMVAIAFISILLYYFLPKYLSQIIAIVMVVVILWVVRYVYDVGRVVVDIFPLFLAGGILTFPATYIYRFFVVDREKRHIQDAFGHYIDRRVVKMIDEDEVAVSLGGERRVATIMFSDIAGFTSISERIGTQDLFYLMSSYLSRMTDILIREGGTLDKYIGDAIMGFFGAPVSQSDHAIRACNTALAMQQALPEFNQEILERGIEPIHFRVGIATGEAMIGNIGSVNHFNYTALGDTVNLASRLEATGKEYGVNIIISESTREQIGDGFVVRELDTIAVQGKITGTRIYELLDKHNDNFDYRTARSYEQALQLYRQGQYLEAGKLWESQMATDAPSRVMAMRCVEILKGNLTVENGVYRMEHK